MDNKDTVPIYVNNNTEILSNKFGELPNGVKVRPSEYYRQTGDLQGAEYANTNVYMKNKFKNGKLPKFALGLPEWLNMATNSIGMISSLTDKSKIDNEPISRPNTRKTNPYADSALNILAQQSFNPYSGYRDIYNIQDKRTYATRNNAGMSAAQRAVAEYAGYNDAMESLAKFNQYAQDKNSALASAYANARLQAGEN